jgi:hypothetical protein
VIPGSGLSDLPASRIADVSGTPGAGLAGQSMSENLVSVPAGMFDVLRVEPRWGKRSVFVSPSALDALRCAQANLPKQLRLVLTRGYEPETFSLRIMRRLGRLLFRVAYWNRKAESDALFHHNGHAVDGDHVDISIAIDGVVLTLLPMGVLTPRFRVSQLERKYAEALAAVRSGLESAGFIIHDNPVEALQIHCDL